MQCIGKSEGILLKTAEIKSPDCKNSLATEWFFKGGGSCEQWMEWIAEENVRWKDLSGMHRDFTRSPLDEIGRVSGFEYDLN